MANRRNNNNNYSWPKTVRDIVVAAINKGQLPILGVCSIFLVIFWRLPANELSDMLRDLIDRLAKGELIAYILLILVCAGWFSHAKKMRTNHTNEVNRISKEKSALQNQLADPKFKGSEK